ncbi:MAG TPA: hypothetical protein VEK57_12085 [Thermoanaerobaculia bacterium]|nr:hypothetical protein [Thermoanaerobaculia bacterium]
MPDPEEREESHGIPMTGIVVGALAAGGAAALLAYGLRGTEGSADEYVSPELREMNAADEERMRRSPDPRARTRQRFTLLLANSLDVPTVAQLLRESLPVTEERLTRRRLYGFESKLGWRVPAFQFAHGQIVRDLDRVVPRLRHDLHPLEVVNWFHRENPDLQLSDQHVSPLAWLQAGGDPGVVAHLAEFVGRPI